MLKLEDLAERFRETVSWCALKGLGSEFPYDGQLLARKLREEKWSEAELQARGTLSHPLRSPELSLAFQERWQPLVRWTSIEVNPEECIMWADNKVIAGTPAAQLANILETNRK